MKEDKETVLPTSTSKEKLNHLSYNYKDGVWICSLNGKELTKQEEESLWIETDEDLEE